MWCPCENPQYHTSTHSFDVAKNAPSELHTYDILTRTAPKKLRKKCKKSRSGELGSQPFMDNYTLWKRKKATRRDQLWSWRGEMVHVRHSDLSVLYTIRLFQNYPSVTPISRKGELGGTLWRNLSVELFWENKKKNKNKKEKKNKNRNKHKNKDRNKNKTKAKTKATTTTTKHVTQPKKTKTKART